LAFCTASANALMFCTAFSAETSFANASLHDARLLDPELDRAPLAP